MKEVTADIANMTINPDADRSGALIIVCAPSGAGKSTLIKRLRAEFPQIGFSVSCTTRAPRDGEVDGRDYHFIDEATFSQRKAAGYFAETASVHGHWYGTPLQPLKDMLADGKDVIFDIDVQGAEQLRHSTENGRYVFIFPPSMKILEERLRHRGTDDDAAIRQRIKNAKEEIQQAKYFEAWIVNNDLDRAYEQFRAFYLSVTLHSALHLRWFNTVWENV